MKLEYKAVKIISNENLIDNVYKMVCECEYKGDKKIEPGQFYMLKHGDETLLPRPISISEKDDKTVTFVYIATGKATEAFSKLKSGDNINVTGPLGNGYSIDKIPKKVAVVGGGIGTAPLIELCKRIREKHKDAIIDVYAGYRDNVFLIDEFKRYSNSINITTNTGKYGHKGFITEILKPEEYEMVLCCGPEVMMKAVVDMCKEKNVPIFISMEKHMAGGVGACLVCTCKTKDGNKRTCKDGPVFDGYYVEL